MQMRLEGSHTLRFKSPNNLAISFRPLLLQLLVELTLTPFSYRSEDSISGSAHRSGVERNIGPQKDS
jgi:hypothetical protein